MEKQLEKYYKEARRKHISYISYLLGGDKSAAEDIVQDSFLKALTKLDQYDPEKGKFSTWFNRILFNTLSNHKRSLKDLRSLENYFNLVDYKNSEASVSSKLDLAKVIDEVEPPSSRDIVFKFYILGWSQEDISDSVGLTKASVGQVCHKFRKEAKRSLK